MRILNSFLQEWKKYFSFKYLTPPAQQKLRTLLTTKNYNKISSRALARHLFIGRRAFDTIKKEKQEEKKEI